MDTDENAPVPEDLDPQTEGHPPEFPPVRQSQTIGTTMRSRLSRFNRFNKFNRAYLERRKKQLFGTRRRTLSTLSVAATVFFVGVAGVVLFVGFLFAWYARDLPRPDKIKRVSGLSNVILDRNGVNLYDIYQDENRIPVELKDIPEYLREGTIAIEDKNFYKHEGLSTTGIIRAAVNIFVFHNFQGGSTLTQQLVKNVLLTQERTLPRKIKEAILAIQIERRYSKDEILQMYLNEAPYGGTAVGVESAAQYYFGKPVKDLGLVESAILAGLPQSPSAYSPFIGQKDAYVWRTQQVLRRMKEDGYISDTQEKEANTQLKNVKFASPSDTSSLRAPHFVQYVREQLVKQFGEQKVADGGLRVTTTLDWKLQEEAQQIVAEEVDKAAKMKVSNGAAVITDPETGEILAMVGSKDYAASESGGYKFNVATQGLRQPGSSIKPVTYATAFKKGYTPATLLMDVETKYPSGTEGEPDYDPKNYDLKYRGPIQLRYALANSINTIAVKLTALVGVKDILRTAYDMGLKTLEPTQENLSRLGLSVTLGGGEVTLLDMTTAYGVFATGGIRHDPVAILKVEDASGKTIFENKKTDGTRVLDQDVCYLISDILSDNSARTMVFGPNSYLNIPGKHVAVKTGTTDDKRDNWTMGYSTKRVVGVWVGNNDNSPMDPRLASGVTGAAPIWNRLIKAAISDTKDEPFIKPDTIVEADVDSYGGGALFEGQPTRKEYFIKGSEPTAPSTIYQQFKISRRDGNKLANQVQINRGDYDTKTFVVFKEQDPISSDGRNRWQEAIDAWVAGQSDPKFHPPTEVDSEDEGISVKFRKPGDKDRINSNSVEVRIEAASSKGVTRTELYVDDHKVRQTDGDSLTDTIDIDNGSHTLRAHAIDGDGRSADSTIHLGINEDYREPVATPTPKPTSAPAPTSAPSATPTPTP